MSGRLKELYFRIGLHAAPPGTLLFRVHNFVSGEYRHSRRPRYPDLISTGTKHPIVRLPTYDVARIRRTRQVDGLALVFFMGLGDYLMATPFIQALRLAQPDLLLYAYASSSADTVNSPLLADLLRANPELDKVFTYSGRPGRLWTDYDYRDALKDVPPGFLILPVRYDTDQWIPHRVTALMHGFGLEAPWPVPAPVLPDLPPSAAVSGALQQIAARWGTPSDRTIVCCHFDARSSGYVYPHTQQLVSRLVRAGYGVLSFTPTDVEDDAVLEIDVTKFRPTDTITLLRQLQRSGSNLRIISVNSLMWPISAGLNIRNLGLHIFHDQAVHQYLYPNIFIITPHIYPRVSPSRLFWAQGRAFENRSDRQGVVFADYDPSYVFACFERFLEAV